MGWEAMALIPERRTSSTGQKSRKTKKFESRVAVPATDPTDRLVTSAYRTLRFSCANLELAVAEEHEKFSRVEQAPTEGVEGRDRQPGQGRRHKNG
jgi:hypothetical protein